MENCLFFYLKNIIINYTNKLLVILKAIILKKIQTRLNNLQYDESPLG